MIQNHSMNETSENKTSGIATEQPHWSHMTEGHHGISYIFRLTMSQRMTEPTIKPVRQAETKIKLGIRLV